MRKFSVLASLVVLSLVTLFYASPVASAAPVMADDCPLGYCKQNLSPVIPSRQLRDWDDLCPCYAQFVSEMTVANEQYWITLAGCASDKVEGCYECNCLVKATTVLLFSTLLAEHHYNDCLDAYYTIIAMGSPGSPILTVADALRAVNSSWLIPLAA